MMFGVAIEDLLELWSVELRKAKARLGWLIDHPSVAASAAAFLDTVLGPEQDGLDARGGGGRCRPLAPAGGAGAQSLGCRRAGRRCGRLCAREAGRGGRRAGPRRDR